MDPLQLAIVVTVYGLTTGCVLALIALGLSLTFGYLGVLNFAHGLLYAFGAYMLFMALAFSGNFWTGLLVSVAVTGLIGLVMERFLLRNLYGKDIDFTLIVTFAVTLVGVDIIKLIWGLNSKPVADPIGLSVNLLGVELPDYRLLIIALALCMYFGVWLFLNKTMVGKIVTAGLEDVDGVRGLGIDPSRSFVIMFVIGSLLAGLGGALYAPIVMVYPYMGYDIVLYAFAVVVLGGMASVKGSIIGGIIIGIAGAIAGFTYGSSAAVVGFVVMAIVLIMKPAGLFGGQ
jgi:branched-subunit amino acid ABC-type transport system permease component